MSTIKTAIVINQTGAPPGAPGASRDDLALGIPVMLSNFDDSGIVAWNWRILSKPQFSMAGLDAPTASSCSFVPDLVGSYLVRLTANGRTNALIIASVKTAYLGLRLPAEKETIEFNGWPVAVNTIFRQLETGLETGLYAATHGPAGGDLSGNYPNPAVVKIQGKAVSPTSPANGRALVWNQSENRWEPRSLSAATMSDLRSALGIEDQTITLGGFYAEGDGGGGLFAWDVNPALDDGGTIVNPGGGTAAGWRRIYAGPLSVKWFGAIGDGITEDSLAIQATVYSEAALLGGRQIYFPAGTYLLGSAISWPLYLGDDSGLVGDAPGQSILKVRDNGPSYYQLFVLGSRTTVRDLGFDQNATGNGSQVSTKNFSILATPGGPTGGFDNVCIENCDFKDLFGKTTLVLGPVDGSDRAFVANCTFESKPIWTFDNTTLFGYCRNLTVVGCRFVGVTTPHPSVSAIEAAGGSAIVMDNSISGYAHGIWHESTTVSYGSDVPTTASVCVGNIVRQARNGIILYNFPNRSLRNVRVDANVIEIDQVAHENLVGDFFDCAGIVLIGSSGTDNFNTVTIANNTVLFVSQSSLALQAQGLGGPSHATEVTNLVIENNTVVGAKSHGIQLGGHLTSVKVTKNTIIIPDDRPSTCAIGRTNGDDWDAYGVRIAENDIFDGYGGGGLRYSLYLHPGLGGAFVAENNRVFETGTVLTYDVYAPRVRTMNSDPQSTAAMVNGVVTVVDNRVNGDSKIMFCRKTAGGTLGHVSVTSIVPANRFVLTSSSAAETSTFWYTLH